MLEVKAVFDITSGVVCLIALGILFYSLFFAPKKSETSLYRLLKKRIPHRIEKPFQQAKKTLVLKREQNDEEEVIQDFDKPLWGDEQDEDFNKEIELAAMKIAEKYEKDKGRRVSDVSNIYVGYDLYSTDQFDSSNDRRIEVKGKSSNGGIIMTRNEWQVAQEKGDLYWLYVVFDALKPKPTLITIQNPHKKIKATANKIQYTLSRSEYTSVSEQYELI